MAAKRILLYLYLALKKGGDYTITFSIDQIVEWCKYKPKRTKGKINEQFNDLIMLFNKHNYFETLGQVSNSIPHEHQLNELMFIPDTYGMIYYDEIYKILNYKSFVSEQEASDKNNGSYNILLVFAYLRWRIGRRKEVYTNGLTKKENKVLFTEAWYCHYKDIADELKITLKNVSKSLKILRDLKLIYFDDITYSFFESGDNGKYYTNKTIFVNYYKRIKKYITQNYYNIEEISGEDYYLDEINIKEKSIQIYRDSLQKGG